MGRTSKKNVEKRGLKWMEMAEDETSNYRDRWRLLSKTRPPDTRGHARLDEEVELVKIMDFVESDRG